MKQNTFSCSSIPDTAGPPARAPCPTFFLFVFCTLLGMNSVSAQETPIVPSPGGAPAWTPLAPDLEVLHLPTAESIMRGSVTFIRSSLKNFRVGVVRAVDYGAPRLDIATLCQRSGAAVCVNANFFDEFGKPLGLVVSRGTLFNKLHNGGSVLTGVLEAGRNYIRIVNRANFDGSSALEAIQAGPRLLLNQVALRGIRDTSRSSRAGVCIDVQRRFVVYALQSSLGGVSLQEMQVLLSHPLVACSDALNLDGGGSAQLYAHPPSTEVAGSAERAVVIRGYDSVPVALGLFARKVELQ